MDNKAQEIIESNVYLSMAVTDNLSPWIFNAYYVFDGEINFYWYSRKNSRHSKIIATNQKVAFCIFDSRSVGDSVDAVYVQANAKEVKDPVEISKVLVLYAKKMLKTNFIKQGTSYKRFVKGIEDFADKSPLRLYKATIKEIWRLAPSKIYNEKYIDSRIKVSN